MHLLAPPQRGYCWLYKLRLRPTITFHLILLPSKKISLFEKYLVYSRGYCLLSSLRVETTSLLSTAIPHLKAPAGTRWVSIRYGLEPAQFESAQLSHNSWEGRSHTCKEIQQWQKGITHPNSILVTSLPLTVKLWAKENLSFGPGSYLLVGETSINAAFLIRGCCESWIRKSICEVNSFIFFREVHWDGNEWMKWNGNKWTTKHFQTT